MAPPVVSESFANWLRQRSQAMRPPYQQLASALPWLGGGSGGSAGGGAAVSPGTGLTQVTQPRMPTNPSEFASHGWRTVLDPVSYATPGDEYDAGMRVYQRILAGGARFRGSPLSEAQIRAMAPRNRPAIIGPLGQRMSLQDFRDEYALQQQGAGPAPQQFQAMTPSQQMGATAPASAASGIFGARATAGGLLGGAELAELRRLSDDTMRQLQQRNLLETELMMSQRPIELELDRYIQAARAGTNQAMQQVGLQDAEFARRAADRQRRQLIAALLGG